MDQLMKMKKNAMQFLIGVIVDIIYITTYFIVTYITMFAIPSFYSSSWIAWLCVADFQLFIVQSWIYYFVSKSQFNNNKW